MGVLALRRLVSSTLLLRGDDLLESKAALLQPGVRFILEVGAYGLIFSSFNVACLARGLIFELVVAPSSSLPRELVVRHRLPIVVFDMALAGCPRPLLAHDHRRLPQLTELLRRLHPRLISALEAWQALSFGFPYFLHFAN